MGKPEDISAPPLTEADVRRIARDEIQKCIGVDDAIARQRAKQSQFAEIYAAKPEEIRQTLAAEVRGDCTYCGEPVRRRVDAGFSSPAHEACHTLDNARRMMRSARNLLAVLVEASDRGSVQGLEDALRDARAYLAATQYASPEKAGVKPVRESARDGIGKTYLRSFLVGAPADVVEKAFADCGLDAERRAILAEAALGGSFDPTVCAHRQALLATAQGAVRVIAGSVDGVSISRNDLRASLDAIRAYLALDDAPAQT